MNDAVPRPAVWRALGLAAIFLLAAAIGLISLISSGRLDPRPAGPLQQEIAVAEVVLSPGDNTITWLPGVALPAPPFTARLRAASEGAATVSYGLALGAPDGYLAVAVSPAGYASITAHSSGAGTPLLLWQPVAHVARGGAENTLQIDVDGAAVTIWLNRQVLWEGESPAAGGQVAVLARSDAGPATVRFEPLQLFAPSWR